MSRFTTLATRLSRDVSGSVLLGLVGTVFLVLSLWNLSREFATLDSIGGPLLAALLNVGLSLLVVYSGVRLRRSDLDPEDEVAVALVAIAGGGTAGLAQAYTFFVRRMEGRPVSEPVFPLVVIAAGGTIAGATLGYLWLQSRARAERAQRVSDAIAFTNSLLRHDVLNGLQVVRGHGEVVAEADDERLARSGEAILGQADSLSELIDELRAVSEILVGEADPEPLDLVPLIESELDTIRDSHPAATFEVSLPSSLVVRGTPALGPVIRNLVTNAVKHNDDDVRVRVTGQHRGERVRIAVADDGRGIPEAERQRVFERGVSTDGGDGLGLHIVATIVERSGGSVHVSDSDLGGAAFVVELDAADGPPD